jgi:hypothetical protein
VLAFLSLLAIPQAFAFVQQFREGFRPFKTAPHRVPFSWDMFSVRIERCDITWEPPLPLPNGPLYRLHQKAKLLEWDFSLDQESDYQLLAHWACSEFHQPSRASLLCFKPEGKEVPSVVECR